MTDAAPNSSDDPRWESTPRVRVQPRKQVPHVQQLEAADCGAASLAMVLGYWGCDVRLDELRDAVGVSNQGASAQAMLDAASRYGLEGRGLRLDVESLPGLPPGTILHWEFNHFVVLEAVTRTGVRIVDPARGRRTMSHRDVARAFTGIALTFDPTERFVPRKDGRSPLAPYIRRLFGDRGLFGRVLAMSALLQALALTLPAVTGVIVDRVVPHADRDLLLILGAGAMVAVLFNVLASLVRGHLLVELRTKLDQRMTVDFIGHLVSLPFAYFQRRQSGDLMMRVNSNATVREFLTSNVLSALLDAALVSGYIGLMALMSPSMALLVLALGLCRVVLLLAVRGRLGELMANQLDAQARSQSYLAQLLTGIETLKAAGAERRSVEHWSNLYTRELNEVAERGRINAWVESLLQGLGAASPLLVIAWGTLLVLQGQQSLGSMLALSAFANAFFTPLSALVSSGLQLSVLGGYLERMDDVLSAEPEQDRSRVVAAPRLRGRISVRGVSFRYREDGPLAVDDATLEIEPGQTVAIVGASGSGKSTLAKLLLGLHRPSHGQIFFDGQDIRHIDAASFRRQIGIVPQHPYLFASSIRDNISLADPSATLHKVMEAARRARIHDDIVRLPMQYDTPLADRGESLSGGQRQRLALARAVLQRPAIMLLDEATSALDAQTEFQVTRNLERLRCTRIVIAHRLSTIARADIIVVMHDGRIVELGRHDELLTRGRVYRELVGAQTALMSG